MQFIHPSPENTFNESGISFIPTSIEFSGEQLEIITTGDRSKEQLLFFIHGAPGSWADFSEYMKNDELLKQFQMVTYNRPGYSDQLQNSKHFTIEEQIEAASKVLSQFKNKEVTLVGYSYGGPIAAGLAGKYPDRIERVILLAPVIDPKHEKIFWFNPFINSFVGRFLMPRYLNVANDEKLHHAEDLEEIESYWTNIKADVYQLHCTDDWIAPFEANTKYAQHFIGSDRYHLISWTGSSHYLPNQQMDRILPVLLGKESK